MLGKLLTVSSSNHIEHIRHTSLVIDMLQHMQVATRICFELGNALMHWLLDVDIQVLCRSTSACVLL